MEAALPGQQRDQFCREAEARSIQGGTGLVSIAKAFPTLNTPLSGRLEREVAQAGCIARNNTAAVRVLLRKNAGVREQA